MRRQMKETRRNWRAKLTMWAYHLLLVLLRHPLQPAQQPAGVEAEQDVLFLHRRLWLLVLHPDHGCLLHRFSFYWQLLKGKRQSQIPFLLFPSFFSCALEIAIAFVHVHLSNWWSLHKWNESWSIWFDFLRVTDVKVWLINFAHIGLEE